MTVLLQVSDPHFGTERRPVAAALQVLVRHQRPDLLVVSGDITQRARRAQFAAARRYFDALGIATRFMVPGNHDIPLLGLWTRCVDPYRHYRQALGPAGDRTMARDDLLLIGLNTTRPWRHTDGEVSSQQVEWAAAQLRQARPGQLRVLVTHQPVHVVRERDAHNRLHGHAAAISAWSAAGADLILGGHIHLPYVAELQAAFPQLPRRLWALQAGTALSSRIRFEANNSVNLLRIAAGRRCIAERWDYHDARAAFECTLQTEIDADHTA
ncbi:metallophosphoesterase family protein [Solimonas marina]|uniref:Metallophosphoesterase n=1 Tax=Solimonas marina TaxID=2714601 RepID=A0A970BBI1_9GAMM|nr:metallophosphoesterase [Solimonas marina]NKF24456.1 metallophosphoesterase [Solimonas marina]